LPAVESLTRRDRGGRAPHELADQVRVLRDDRLLQEERPVWLEQRGDATSIGEREPAVEVDGHIAVIAQHVAGRGHPPHHPIEFGDCCKGAHPSGCVHLDRGKALRQPRADLVGDLARLVATHPPVHPDPVPDRAAEQLVHRCGVPLTRDVPQRLIEP
jgi:hypothetical protein